MFEPGDVVRASGEGGTFVVRKVRSNGDVECWGGLAGHAGVKNTTGHAQHRTSRPDRLRKVNGGR